MKLGEGVTDQGNFRLKDISLSYFFGSILGYQLLIESKRHRIDHFDNNKFIHLSTALGFKTGKENVTTVTPGVFACKKIYFTNPFYGGPQVKVLASVGHTVKGETPRNGAAVWVEEVKASEFTVCVLEFGDGSNKSVEVNWIAFQSALPGSQIGITSLNAWTTGTECKRIDFQQVRIICSCLCFPLPPSPFPPPPFLFPFLFSLPSSPSPFSLPPTLFSLSHSPFPLSLLPFVFPLLPTPFSVPHSPFPN